MEPAHSPNSISHFKRLYSALILPCVWKFLSNPHTDHDLKHDLKPYSSTRFIFSPFANLCTCSVFGSGPIKRSQPLPMMLKTKPTHVRPACHSCQGVTVNVSHPEPPPRQEYTPLLYHSCCFVASESLCPQGLQPTRLFCPRDSPGKNTGVGCHFPSPGGLPDRGIEPASPALQLDSLPLSH